jgi:hypothetical protein
VIGFIFALALNLFAVWFNTYSLVEWQIPNGNTLGIVSAIICIIINAACAIWMLTLILKEVRE